MSEPTETEQEEGGWARCDGLPTEGGSYWCKPSDVKGALREHLWVSDEVEAAIQAEAEARVVRDIVLRETARADRLQTALERLLESAQFGWVMIPPGQPEHRQLRDAVDEVRRALSPSTEAPSEEN